MDENNVIGNLVVLVEAHENETTQASPRIAMAAAAIHPTTIQIDASIATNGLLSTCRRQISVRVCVSYDHMVLEIELHL